VKVTQGTVWDLTPGVKEGVGSRDAGVMSGDVRERQQPGDVADRVDPPGAGPQPGIDDHSAALVNVHADGVEAEVLGQRPPAGDNEDPVKDDRFPGRRIVEPKLVGAIPAGAHVEGPAPETDVDALRRQPRRDQLAGAGFLLDQQSFRLLDDGHVRAEPSERLAELAPDRATAQDHEPWWQPR